MRAALRYHDSSKAWAVYMAPIGFLDKSRCQDWFAATGHQSKVFGTVDSFLAYSLEALEKREKSITVGMLTHWLGKPTSFQRLADVTKTDAIEMWTHNPHLRRYGTLMILRRVGAKLQVIWYDPWHDGQAIKSQYWANATKIFNYREVVKTKVAIRADWNDITVDSWYWGGRSTNVPSEYRNDSVKISLSHLQRLVGTDFQELPDAGDSDGFNNSGFLLSQ